MKKIYKSIAFLLTAVVGVFTNNLALAQQWQAMQDVPVNMVYPVVVELRGDIHVIGGGSTGGATNLHLRYKPATNTWDTLAPVPYLAQQPAGAVVNDKIFYCGGGYPNTGTPLAKNYYYDPDSLQWYQAADMPVPTAIHEAAACDGKLYVLSGQPNKTLCEYYDPVSNTWHQNNPLPDMNFWYGAILSADSTIFRFGGGGYSAAQKLAYRYDRLNDTWIPLPDMPEPCHGVAGTNLGDSLIVYSGGYVVGETKNKTWIYNIATQQYALSDTLPIARDYHAMATAQGCVYSVGGDNSVFPSVGTSMIKNCAPQIVNAVTDIVIESKPYSVLTTSDFMLIQFTSSIEGTVQLIDISGRVLSTQNINSNSLMLQNEKLSAGIYLVNIRINNYSFTEKWMIE